MLQDSWRDTVRSFLLSYSGRCTFSSVGASRSGHLSFSLRVERRDILASLFSIHSFCFLQLGIWGHVSFSGFVAESDSRRGWGQLAAFGPSCDCRMECWPWTGALQVCLKCLQEDGLSTFLLQVWNLWRNGCVSKRYVELNLAMQKALAEDKKTGRLWWCCGIL